MSNKSFFIRMLAAIFILMLLLVLLIVLEDSDKSSLIDCQRDIKCWSKKHKYLAESKCKPLIEKLSEYGVEWNTRFKHPIFNHYTISTGDNRELLFTGNRVHFRQGDGASMKMQYGCYFDTKSLDVIDVVLNPY